jgi:hypothetical protein
VRASGTGPGAPIGREFPRSAAKSASPEALAGHADRRFSATARRENRREVGGELTCPGERFGSSIGDDEANALLKEQSMTAIRRHLPSPALIVACVALVVALGGVSYAAAVLPKNSVGTAQLKKKAVTGAKLKKDAVTGAKVKNGSLLAADFKAGQLPAGQSGPQGPKGESGAPGSTPDPLATGRTLRGTYGFLDQASAGGQLDYESLPFGGFTLTAAPIAHVILQGSPAPAECPGTVASPAAAPGHLCVYEQTPMNRATLTVFNPIDDGTTNTSRVGTVLRMTSTAAGQFFSRGTWAVTAP